MASKTQGFKYILMFDEDLRANEVQIFQSAGLYFSIFLLVGYICLIVVVYFIEKGKGKEDDSVINVMNSNYHETILDPEYTPCKKQDGQRESRSSPNVLITSSNNRSLIYEKPADPNSPKATGQSKKRDRILSFEQFDVRNDRIFSSILFGKNGKTFDGKENLVNKHTWKTKARDLIVHGNPIISTIWNKDSLFPRILRISLIFLEFGTTSMLLSLIFIPGNNNSLLFRLSKNPQAAICLYNMIAWVIFLFLTWIFHVSKENIVKAANSEEQLIAIGIALKEVRIKLIVSIGLTVLLFLFYASQFVLLGCIVTVSYTHLTLPTIYSV
eukprot:TRINITY_DN13862_c0_g1_i2.p1 TRINITY_DN13862_c0_g1~~TRINITY_DN13862_c0_g1_i2.p1  ORF type:complete len:327 (+),score=55.77 TRINITY_DN13862_c0_g1_i2:127-1107(+)